MRDLFFWSFLMASAHGAGLMVAPVLLTLTSPAGIEGSRALVVCLAVALHTAAMLLVMGFVAWVVYKKLGLAVLRKGWLNCDLLWACALLIVGAVSLYGALWGVHHH